MLYKRGSKGKIVKEIQLFLGLNDDGIFGTKTEQAVKDWQLDNGLTPDGIVGPITLECMGLLTTDNTDTFSKDLNINIDIIQNFMDKNEYFTRSNPEYIFLHHTAGWHNPINQIRGWNTDNRGKIGTEFVIGGQSVKGNNFQSDGLIAQAFPHGGWGWHLGTGRSNMHTNSVGIELCNFGWLKNGRTYVGTIAENSQIIKLKNPFRGHRYWHKYSDSQIASLRDLIIYIGNRDNINIREGLPTWIKSIGTKAFEYSDGAKRGKVKGLLSHSNVRRDKFDIFPQPEIMDMLISL